MINKLMRLLGYVSIDEISRRHRSFLRQQKRIQQSTEEQYIVNKASHFIEAGIEIWSDVYLNMDFEEEKDLLDIN